MLEKVIRHIIAVVMLAVLLSQSAMPASAQEDYRFDIGGGLGMTGYLGDANTSTLWGHQIGRAHV